MLLKKDSNMESEKFIEEIDEKLDNIILKDKILSNGKLDKV